MRDSRTHFLAAVSLCLCLCFQPTRSSSPWKGAPWQNYDDSILEQLRYNDLSPTIFSPTGRLHPVERTMEEVRDLQGNVVVALKCQDGVLMLSTVPLSPYLNTTVQVVNNTTSLVVLEDEDDSSILPMVHLCNGVVGVSAGKPMDSRVLRLRMQATASQLLDEDIDQPSSILHISKLARQLADQLQGPTQKTNTRQIPLLSSAAVVMNHQGEIWRIDPTGQFWKCLGAVLGRESDKVEEEIFTRLMERRKEVGDRQPDIAACLEAITCEEALDLICECLQSILWPASLNLNLIPEGVRAHIPSIPWVAVSFSRGDETSSTTEQPHCTRRGAFLPPVGQRKEESAEEAR